MHPHAQMNRCAYTHAHTQMFVLTQIHTQICASSFLLSQQVGGDFGVDVKKKKKGGWQSISPPASTQDVTAIDRFSCGHTKTMSAWVAINLRTAFIKKHTASLPPQHVYLTQVTGWMLLQTQVMSSAPLPLFKPNKQMMHWGDRVHFWFLCVLSVSVSISTSLHTAHFKSVDLNN